jgi:hypothetical protein
MNTNRNKLDQPFPFNSHVTNREVNTILHTDTHWYEISVMTTEGEKWYGTRSRLTDNRQDACSMSLMTAIRMAEAHHKDLKRTIVPTYSDAVRFRQIVDSHFGRPVQKTIQFTGEYHGK